MLVLPLNSVINPLLYDNTLKDFLTQLFQVPTCSGIFRHLNSFCATLAVQTQVTSVETGVAVGEGMAVAADNMNIKPQGESNVSEQIKTETEP